MQREQDSLAGRTLLVWVFAVVFVGVCLAMFRGNKERADCLQDAVMFEEFDDYGFTLRERLMWGDLCGIPALPADTLRWLSEEGEPDAP